MDLGVGDKRPMVQRRLATHGGIMVGVNTGAAGTVTNVAPSVAVFSKQQAPLTSQSLAPSTSQSLAPSTSQSLASSQSRASLRKCRALFGVNAKHLWCVMCKRKKNVSELQ